MHILHLLMHTLPLFLLLLLLRFPDLEPNLLLQLLLLPLLLMAPLVLMVAMQVQMAAWRLPPLSTALEGPALRGQAEKGKAPLRQLPLSILLLQPPLPLHLLLLLLPLPTVAWHMRQPTAEERVASATPLNKLPAPHAQGPPSRHRHGHCCRHCCWSNLCQLPSRLHCHCCCHHPPCRCLPKALDCHC